MSQPPARRGVGRGRRIQQEPAAPIGSAGQSIAGSAAVSSSTSDAGRALTPSSALSTASTTSSSSVSSTHVPRSAPDSPGDSGVEDLVKKTANVEIVDLVRRPGFGVTGQRAVVHANFFEVAMKQELNVIQYHVEVSHERLKLTRDEKRIAFFKCVETNPSTFPNRFAVAYDGDHLCVCLEHLKFPGKNRVGIHIFEIKTRLPRLEREEILKLEFKFVGLVHVTTRNVKPAATSERYTTPMQILDILIRMQRSSTSEEMSKLWYPHGPTIYRIPENGGTDLTCGRAIWQGLFGAAHVGQNFIPYINFDVSHSGFYKYQNAIQFMIDILNANFSQRRGCNDFSVQDLNSNTSLQSSWITAINREIKGLKVVMEIRRANGESYQREYRVNGLIPENAINKTFGYRSAEGEEKKISVASYFKEKYGQIRFPNLNLLHVGSRKREVFVPLEAVWIANNQRVNKKLTSDQLSVMIKATAINAPNRKDKISDLVRQSGFNQDPYLKTFGIQLNPEMKQVESRVLPPPKIQYGPGRNPMVEPRDGSWDCRNQKFFIPASCDAIGALVIDDRDHNVYGNFFGFLLRTCSEFGMQVPANIEGRHVRVITPNNNTAQIEPNLTALVNMGIKFIVVAVPQKSSVYYSEVKRVAEVVLGVMTQCVVKATVTKCMAKMDRMTTTNIALKINAKLGGVNSKADADSLAQRVLFDKSTMVLGIDVTHPSPLELKAPSVAAVVGNLDDTFMRYAASVRVQKHRREAMVYLQDPVRERLVEYFNYGQQENERRRKAGQPLKADLKPQRLIIFRDGVGEGQFQQVLREEMAGIRAACKQLADDYKPKITVIVAQKRHHARFFPTSQQTACGRAMNVRPGTVVDKDITHPDQFEFYLCSHFGIQGTSRPVRYHVIYDDNNFSADHIQVMTYYMCHLYARCTRAVSIPAPVYYADLACRRARVHLYDKIADFGSDTMSVRSGSGTEMSGASEDELIKSSTVADGLKMRMYFA